MRAWKQGALVTHDHVAQPGAEQARDALHWLPVTAHSRLTRDHRTRRSTSRTNKFVLANFILDSCALAAPAHSGDLPSNQGTDPKYGVRFSQSTTAWIPLED
jgi:hypothetical protein